MCDLLIVPNIQEVDASGSPRADLLEDFCRDTIINRFEANSLGLLKDTVTAVQHTSLVAEDDGVVSGAEWFCLLHVRGNGMHGKSTRIAILCHLLQMAATSRLPAAACLQPGPLFIALVQQLLYAPSGRGRRLPAPGQSGSQPTCREAANPPQTMMLSMWQCHSSSWLLRWTSGQRQCRGRGLWLWVVA